MQIPFFSKWVQVRRERQERHDYEAAAERYRITREAEIAAELDRIDNERFEQMEREDQTHVVEFGHKLYATADGKCDVCTQAEEDAMWVKEEQEHRDQFGHEFSGNTFCSICDDLQREDALEQEMIFAQ